VTLGARRRPATDRADHVRIVAVLGLAAVSSALPGFLTGALSVQARGEFAVSTAVYGWAMAGYFLGATLVSTTVGRVAQRIGPRRQLVAALLVTAGAQMVLAVGARSFAAYVACLVTCGVANAATQTAVNLALTEARLPRLGLAIALKQSGMPTASMLSGLAVPLLALTIGWRWSFVVAGAVSASAALLIARSISATPSGPHPPVARSVDDPDGRAPSRSPTRALVGAAVASGFLAFGAGALTSWVVESGVDAGVGNGVAGLLLSGGAALGVAIRLWWGFRLDDLDRPPFRVAGLMAFVGAAGMALLAVRVPAVHVLATVVAFAGGWIWPVFTNFGIVRANTGDAGAATGITQTGVYAGVLAAPLVTGVLIDRAGYGVMWIVVGATMIVGATTALRVAHHF
jgi:predicted MFS family arabinose efflux permease